MTATLTPLAKLVLREYRLRSHGADRFLTDAMRKALVAEAVLGVMLTLYEVEAERERPTSPNVYVDAALEVESELGLR